MPNKGQHGGHCHRTVCRNRARHYNQGTNQYYCSRCARLIQKNAPDGMVLFVDFAPAQAAANDGSLIDE